MVGKIQSRKVVKSNAMDSREGSQYASPFTKLRLLRRILEGR